MRIHKALRLLLLTAVLACLPIAQAQMGAQGVPDLSGFADAIAKSVANADSAPAKPATTPQGAPAKPAIFRSGMDVPSVNPGEASREIARQIRTSIEKQAGPQEALAKLEEGMPQVLAGVEKALESIGFAKRDAGVAVAYMFIYAWETANNQKIPEEPTKVAARNIASAIAKSWGPKFSTLAPAEREKAYETLIVSTTLVVAFTEQFEKAGKLDEAKAMRATAAQFFEKLIGVPPSQVKFSDQGAITGLASK